MHDRRRGGWTALFCAGLAAVCLGLPSRGPAAEHELPADLRQTVDRAIGRMRPALVRIHVVSTDYREGREVKTQTVGSGAIFTRDGYLVTNHHVAGHAARIVCTLWNREELEADLVGTDPLTDISVLKLKGEPGREFAAAQFGDSAGLKVGDWILAMGSPMALSQSVTLGIVSNTEMTMPRGFSQGQFQLDGEDVGRLVRWIGHDAAIYGGNSGGPLVNLQGEIVGINEISYGLGGAIPGNLAREVAELLRKQGKIQRSWVGLDLQPLFKHAKAERGVLIGGVVAESPAARAGLQSGDLLLEIAGTQTNARYEEQMPDVIRTVTSLPIGQPVKFQVLRAGKSMQFELSPVERGTLNPDEREAKAWGLTVSDVSFLTAKEMRRPTREGVLVTSVRPGGPAGEAKPPLRARDVITHIDREPVRNTDELVARTAELTKGKSQPVPAVVTFEREAQRFLTVVALGIQELRDPGLEVAKAWLPVETQVISREIARQLNQPELRGVYVTQVYPGTSAEKAGLKAGDFIVAVDDEKLTASAQEHQEEFPTLIRQYDIGAKVELAVLRGNERLKLSAELERSPKLRREMKKYRNNDFEFTAREISFFDTAEKRWDPGQTGVLVEDVKSGSWAELASLSADDLIVEVDGQPVRNVESLRKILEQVARERKSSVVMRVLRGIHSAYLEFEPAWK